jgi:hypothetical protein
VTGKPRRRRWLTGFIAVSIATFLVVLCSFAADAAFAAPWAYALPGMPSLTGTWEGGFTTASGLRYALFLDLRRPVLANGSPQMQSAHSALFSGEANWCDSQGRKVEGVRIGGGVPVLTGYRGSADRVEIDFDYGGNPPPGLLLLNLQGKWSGDTLTVQPMFTTWNGKTFVYSSDSPDLISHITIVLKKIKYDAFPEACGTLVGTAP